MPRNIRDYSSVFLLIITFVFTALAQDTTPAVMSSADVMRERVAKAKAYIVVKNYNAAIYELDNIKRESADPTVQSVVNVLLMNSFLEQGDYKRAQDFLSDSVKDLKSNKFNAAANYFAIASQVIRSAKNQYERYRSLGFNVSDRNLPMPATEDIQKMRETLESVIGQSKELGKDPKNMDNAMALLEGATTTRGSFAKDDYDANRWKMEVGDAREQLTNSRSTVLNAVTMPPSDEVQNAVAANTNPANLPNSAQPTEQSPIMLPVSKESTGVEKKPGQLVINNSSDKAVPKTQTVQNSAESSKQEIAKTETDPKRKRVIISSAPKNQSINTEEKTNESEAIAEPTDASNVSGPLEVGSLIGYATKKSNPVYPSVAKTMRMTGVVKVEVIIDEDGKVAEAQAIDGPSMLQSAARDAIKKWQFKPFKRDGEPVKATGFINFNFSL